MTQCNQIQNVLLQIKFVDDTVITDAKPIFRASFEPMVRVSAQARAQIVNLGFNQLAYSRR